MIFDKLTMELAADQGRVRREMNCDIMLLKGESIMSELKAIFHKCEPPETGYWAEVPSLPGCVSEGETLEECKAMIRDAAEGWLETAWMIAS